MCDFNCVIKILPKNYTNTIVLDLCNTHYSDTHKQRIKKSSDCALSHAAYFYCLINNQCKRTKNLKTDALKMEKPATGGDERTSLVFSVRGPIPIQLGNISY